MADLKERKRKIGAVEETAKRAPEKIRPYIVKAAPYLVMAQELFVAALPYLVKAYELACQAWKKLEPYHPEELLPVVIGICMAFLGGEFPALMAAVEAYRQVGWEPTWEALQVLYSDAKKVILENEKDNQKDGDGNGKSDVKELTQAEYVQRKTTLILRTVDPQACTNALEALAAGATAVVAVLKVRFAKVIALGASIGDCLRGPAMRYALPPLKQCLPEDLQKWAEPTVSYVCKVVAISLTWWIQRIISAFHSAIRGGHMAGKGVVNYLHKFGYMKAHADDTYADEIAGYTIAAAGFVWQVVIGFRLFFPLNLLLLPLTITDYMIVWFISE